MNKSFKISKKEYLFYIKYFNLIKNEKLLDTANTRIENYVTSNDMKYIDYFLNSCIQNYSDIFFLDFLSKFFFRRSIIRLKLNMILALQEADYDNFNRMIDSTNMKIIILDLFKFIIILLTFPIWLLYKFFIFKLNLVSKNV